MRILHTVSFYHPDEGGGAQAVVTQLSERLARRGHDVTVATTFSPSRTGFEHNDVKIEQFRIFSPLHHSALGIYGEIRRYLDFLAKNNFDVVMNYAAQTWHTDLTCRVLPALTAKKVLVACGYSGLIGLRRLIYWRYFQRIPKYLRQYDMVVYHAENYIDKDFGDRHGITNYRIIPNGVDQVEFQGTEGDFRDLLGIQTPFIILTVGNHFTNKGHARILSAFEQLGRDDVTIVIVGRNVAPPLRSCWKTCSKASKKHGERVLLLDNAPRSHVIAAYASADIFVSGSSIEAFPLVIIESMASCTPFVSFPAGNILDMAGGIVVHTISEMVNSIEELLTHRELRMQMGREGQTMQRSLFEWESVVDKYEMLYRNLVK